MKRFIIQLILMVNGIVLINGCAPKTTATQMDSIPQNKSKNINTFTEFVEHNYISQQGETLDSKEWYVRMSAQDYFIKWCSSKVTQQEIETLLAKETGLIKTLNVELEIKEGEWDNCDPDVRATSRTGRYAIVLSVLE